MGGDSGAAGAGTGCPARISPDGGAGVGGPKLPGGNQAGSGGGE
jgi:hypothetical protein